MTLLDRVAVLATPPLMEDSWRRARVGVRVGVVASRVGW